MIRRKFEKYVLGDVREVWKSLNHVWLCDPKNSPGQNTGVGSLSLLQGIFSTQESYWGLPHYGADSLPAEPPGKPWEMLSWAIMLLSNAEQQETRAFSPSFQGKSKSVRKGDRGTTLWACFSRGDGQIKLFDRTCWTAGHRTIFLLMTPVLTCPGASFLFPWMTHLAQHGPQLPHHS